MTGITILGLIPEFCALFMLGVLIFINWCKDSYKTAESCKDFLKCEIAATMLVVVDIIRYMVDTAELERAFTVAFHAGIVLMSNCIVTYIYDVIPLLRENTRRFCNVKNKVTAVVATAMVATTDLGLICDIQDGEVVLGKLYFISYLVGATMFTICIIGAIKAKTTRKIRHSLYFTFACTVLPCLVEFFYRHTVTNGIGFVTGLVVLSTLFHGGVFDMTHGTEPVVNVSRYLRNKKYSDCNIIVFSIKQSDRKDNLGNVDECIHRILLVLKENFKYETIFAGDDKYVIMIRNTAFELIKETWRDIKRACGKELECKSVVINSRYLNGPDVSILMKAELRDEIYAFSDTDAENIKRKNKIRRTIQAIVDNEWYSDERVITLVQPIIDLKRNKFLTGEMLTRLKVDGIEGVVMPNEFIPIVDELRLTHRFNLCILDNACRLMRKMRAEGVEFDAISVNFDPCELLDKSFVGDVTSIVWNNGLSTNCIHIEITESNDIDEVAGANECIDKLRQAGFEVYLDDFGTKYSNVVELLSAKFDVIKLDRQLILKALEDKASKNVISALSKACSTVGYRVLFEGVDSKEGVKLARENGASYIQGFHYSRPLGWNDLVSFVREKNNQTVDVEGTEVV